MWSGLTARDYQRSSGGAGGQTGRPSLLRHEPVRAHTTEAGRFFSLFSGGNQYWRPRNPSCCHPGTASAPSRRRCDTPRVVERGDRRADAALVKVAPPCDTQLWYRWTRLRRGPPMSRNTSVSFDDHFAEFVDAQVLSGRYGRSAMSCAPACACSNCMKRWRPAGSPEGRRGFGGAGSCTSGWTLGVTCRHRRRRTSMLRGRRGNPAGSRVASEARSTGLPPGFSRSINATCRRRMLPRTNLPRSSTSQTFANRSSPRPTRRCSDPRRPVCGAFSDAVNGDNCY
ncbi:antitoxin of ParD toxin-antitoxin type II system and RHH [Burkholderia sp. WP9]|nr:antitoxin of ParD toxin-antitoxin type II system and RHH [Burkholderia sp. WP9]